MPRYELIRPVRQSRMARLWDAVRSYRIGPISLKDPELIKYFGGGETSTGLSVSEYTAMNLSSVWRAVTVVSDDVASLPMMLYRRDGKKTIQYEGHPLYRILHDDPNPEMSSLTFRQTLQAHAMTWGNGYAEIERDMAGRPKYLWPITPDRVAPFRDGAVLRYRVKNENGREVILNLDDMLHIRGLGWDGTQGYGVLSKARESVALGLAAEKFGATFYGNGSTFGGVIKHPTKFSTPLARENFEKSLRNRNQGVARAHGLLLLEEGMEYTQMGIPPDQAQFLESRQFQITEIARWFGVPPHKIGDLSRSAFANIDAQNIEYVQQTILHWAVTWEQEAMRKLISPLERNQQFIKIIIEGLLRGDSQGRAALEATEFNIGALTPNEARAFSERNPLDGGDRGFVQAGMIPLDRVDEYLDAQIASLKAKANPPGEPPASDDSRVAVLDTELRGEKELNAVLRSEVEGWKAHNRELSDALSVATAGLAEARSLTDTERRNRVTAESALEQLTERLSVTASQLADAESRMAIAGQVIVKQDEQVKTFEADVARLSSELSAAGENLAAVGRELAAERKSHEGVQAELVTLTAERDQWKATSEGHAESLVSRAIAIDELRFELSSQAQELADEQIARKAVEVDLLARTTERDDALVIAAEASEKVLSLAANLDDVRTIALKAESARTDAEVRAEAAERDKAIAEQAAGAANELLEAQRQRDRQRLTAALMAHRSLLSDVLRRLGEREVERAKSRQQTPDKLKAWAATFYDTFEPAMAEALVPAVRVYLAWQQDASDPRTVAADMARAYCAESRSQLADVVAGHPDDFQVALAGVLERWERDRPDRVADGVVREALMRVGGGS